MGVQLGKAELNTQKKKEGREKKSCQSPVDDNKSVSYRTDPAHPGIERMGPCFCLQGFLGEEEIHLVVFPVFVVRNHVGTNKFGFLKRQ